MSKLEKEIDGKFSGILVLGDIHANFTSLKDAFDYAREHNLFVILLGDIVDRGRFPFESVSLVKDLMDEKKCGLLVGNHDDKFRRLALGNKVSLSYDQKQTLEDVGDHRDTFLSMYKSMQETSIYCSYFYDFGNYMFSHAAYHPELIEGVVPVSEARSRCLYGEVTGETESDGMPIRYYNWINEIPEGRTMFVGHDRKPIHNVLITEPLEVTGTLGGKAVFMDTGCGKGGFLTGAVIKRKNNGDYFTESYKAFK